MTSVAELFDAAFREAFSLDTEQTVSDWADTHRVIAEGQSPEPGRWRTSRVPYLREIMDRLSINDPTERVVVMKGTRLGFTEVGVNFYGYVMEHAPGPALICMPTRDMCKELVRDRLRPMIESAPELQERELSGSTLMKILFRGGTFRMRGMNSGAGLRFVGARYLMCDEVDAYPGEVRGEGDPVALAEKRTEEYERRKLYYVSSPGLKGLSRIESLFNRSDRRRYFLPCPYCGEWDWIRPKSIRWPPGKPERARLKCLHCEKLIPHREKLGMLQRGRWQPTVEGDGQTAGYHISSLYSPWRSWGYYAQEFLAAKQDTASFQVFVNTVWAETWEVRAEKPPRISAIEKRREHYKAEVPNGVGALVCSVDVQGDRLELIVKGYGEGQESWLIAREILLGDTKVDTGDSVWFELDRYLRRTFTHESGRKVGISCTVIDGNYESDVVYKFCATRKGRRVYVVRGGRDQGKPLVPKASTANAYRVRVYTLCSDTGKNTVMRRLKISEPGPGYMHFPKDVPWLDTEYFEQLVNSERRVPVKPSPGKPARWRWLEQRERNEAFDLEYYALAALHIRGRHFVQSLPERAVALAKPLDRKSAARPSAVPQAVRRPSRSGWMSRIKR